MNFSSIFLSPLMILFADFLLSLVATWVLFRVLRSGAFLSNPKWRASGAVAGFIMIFSLSFTFSDNWQEKYLFAARRYNIEGTVALDSARFHEGTVAAEIPPAACALTGRDGSFLLTGIRFPSPTINGITIEFRHDGYIPRKYTYRAGRFTIDQEKLLITLNDTLRLRRIPAEMRTRQRK